jgi:hypothetical protein
MKGGSLERYGIVFFFWEAEESIMVQLGEWKEESGFGFGSVYAWRIAFQ